ncbi:hypothetical protein ACEPAH_9609 [Sanghuangporus vaninii]
MGLITRAMAKRLAANNGGSEIAEVRRTVADGKDSAVNVDMERDVNESCISANDRGAESNEVLKSEIHRESESITPCEPPSADPKSGTNGRRRGTKATRATRPRRIRQPTKRKGGSSRETSAPDVSGNHVDAKNNNGTSEETSKVAIGRKRAREETSDADLQTSDVVSKRTKTRRIHRNIRRSTPVGEAPSVVRNLRDSTNANSEVEVNDVLNLPASQYGVEHIPDEMPVRNSVSGSAAVCSGQSQEKENASVARLTSSPLERSRRKGTCSGIEFVLARAMLALSKPRISSNNTGPSGEKNEAHFLLPVEAFQAPRLDPDDFAFLIRRATPYRFEESNMRNEAIIRPAPEE